MGYPSWRSHSHVIMVFLEDFLFFKRHLAITVLWHIVYQSFCLSSYYFFGVALKIKLPYLLLSRGGDQKIYIVISLRRIL